MRIGFALIGNPPFMPTGYGTQCRLMADYLISDGYDVCHISDWNYSGPVMDYRGIAVYPVSEHPGTLNSDDLSAKISHFCAERDLDDIVCIFLGDIWKWNGLGAFPPNSLIICPVDGDALMPREVMELGSFRHVAAMSQHGADVIQEHTGMKPLLLPHGFDPELLEVVEGQSMRAIRSRWAELHSKSRVRLPRGDAAFVVGFFGDMSIRKEPEINLGAFRRFVEGLPVEERENVKLFLKSKPEHSQGQDLSIYKRVGIPDSMVLTIPESLSKLGLTTTQMGRLLKGADVLLHCSSQEGFGIFQIEAQALGTPVINTNFGPMAALNACEDLIVAPVSYRTSNGVNYGQADLEAIAQKLRLLYDEWKDDEEGRVLWRSRQQVVSDWAQHWSYDEVYASHIRPALESVVEGLKEPRITIRKPNPTVAHICFISTYDTDCGIATYTRMLSHALIDAGFRVSVLAETTPEHPVSEEIEEDSKGVEIYRCWARNAPQWALAEEILQKITPDIVHAQHEWTMVGHAAPALRSLLASASGGRVITWHTPDFPANQRALSEFMQFDSICDLHVLHNRSKVPIVASQCMNGVTHIDHGIPKMETNPQARSTIGVAERAPMIFTYGFLSGGKGVHTLLKAAVLAAEEAPYFELVAYGGAHPEYPTHPQLLEECHAIAALSKQVHFIPELLSEEDLDLHCQATDYLAFPYEGELLTGSAIMSSSGAVFRTLAAGKPVIVSDEGRLRDLIGGVHGWKVAQGDVVSLKDAIVDAVFTKVKNPSKYEDMRIAVLSLADRLSWDKIATRHARAYEKACSLWGIYSSSATGAFTGVAGEPVDFMAPAILASSTGSEMNDLAKLADELPSNMPEEFDRKKMIRDIDNMEVLDD